MGPFCRKKKTNIFCSVFWCVFMSVCSAAANTSQSYVKLMMICGELQRTNNTLTLVKVCCFQNHDAHHGNASLVETCIRYCPPSKCLKGSAMTASVRTWDQDPFFTMMYRHRHHVFHVLLMSRDQVTTKSGCLGMAESKSITDISGWTAPRKQLSNTFAANQVFCDVNQAPCQQSFVRPFMNIKTKKPWGVMLLQRPYSLPQCNLKTALQVAQNDRLKVDQNAWHMAPQRAATSRLKMHRLYPAS